MKMVGGGEERTNGECEVPLLVWRHPTFQGWYKWLVGAGNRLDGARVLWTFRPGNGAVVFSFALLVDVFIKAEGRNKKNEFVLGRTDISSTVLWSCRRDSGTWATMGETKIALVREFRSPGRVPDGMIHELPGGSSSDASKSPLEVAVEEVREETGLALDPSRFVSWGYRQAAGTLSAHVVGLFSCELTLAEMAGLELLAARGTALGNEGETERTYIEVKTYDQLLKECLVDWSTLGMVSRVISG